MMKTLHLISDDKMQHTIHLGDSNTVRYDDAIEHLKSEACGTKNTIIICNEDNIPSNYITFAGSPRRDQESNLDNHMLIAIAIALVVAYMIIT